MNRQILSTIMLVVFLALSMLAIAQDRVGERQVGIIAHRGYWTTAGSSQNSRASLHKAQELEIFGSEIDVWVTTDGVVMVNHDNKYNGVVLEKSTAEECRKLMLSNGELMPTLDELLAQLAESRSGTKLIIEIKAHSSAERDYAAADAAMALVRRHKIEKEVEYISFSMHACNRLLKNDPKAKVAYLSGDKSPNELHKMGHTGLDYNIKVFREHPDWVAEAHALGMLVNVWTVDKPKDIIEMINLGVDYVTTDEPVLMRKLLNE